MVAKSPLEEMLKQGVIRFGNDAALIVQRVSSGLTVIDQALDGGLAFGKHVLCVGPESTGKTLLAQMATASIQKLDPTNRVILVDAEWSFDPAWWARSEVDLARLYVIRPTTGEEAINGLYHLGMSDKTVKMVITDSIAALTPSIIVEKEAGERNVAALAQLMVSYFAKAKQLQARGVLMWANNQLRANIGGYEDVYPGGGQQRFDSHVILRLRRSEWILEANARVGYVLEVLIKKTKIGGDQQTTVEIPIRFSQQIDVLTSLLDQAIELGHIQKAGPYYSWPSGPRLLGRVALKAHFEGDAASMENLRQAVVQANGVMLAG